MSLSPSRSKGLSVHCKDVDSESNDPSHCAESCQPALYWNMSRGDMMEKEEEEFKIIFGFWAMQILIFKCTLLPLFISVVFLVVLISVHFLYVPSRIANFFSNYTHTNAANCSVCDGFVRSSLFRWQCICNEIGVRRLRFLGSLLILSFLPLQNRNLQKKGTAYIVGPSSFVK